MSRLDAADRVYAEGLSHHETSCHWFAKCPNPANGLRDHPILGQVPICQRCDDRVEAMQ